MTMTPTLSTHSTSAQLFWLHTRQCAVLSLREPMGWLAALYVGMGSLRPPSDAVFWAMMIVLGSPFDRLAAPKLSGLPVPGLPLTPWQRAVALSLGMAWPALLAVVLASLGATVLGHPLAPQGLQLLLGSLGLRVFTVWSMASTAAGSWPSMGFWKPSSTLQPLAQPPRSLLRLWLAGFGWGLAWQAVIVAVLTALGAAAVRTDMGRTALLTCLILPGLVQREPLGLGIAVAGGRPLGAGRVAAELLPVSRARLRMAFALHYALTTLAVALLCTIMGALLPVAPGRGFQALGGLTLASTPFVVAVRMLLAFARDRSSIAVRGGLVALLFLALLTLLALTTIILP